MPLSNIPFFHHSTVPAEMGKLFIRRPLAELFHGGFHGFCYLKRRCFGRVG